MKTNAPRTHALEAATRLKKAGHTVLLAGGCVRDQLLGRTPKDYDLATSATPEEVLSLFPRSDAAGAHFGIVIVKGRKGSGLATEVATFRTDGSYSDHRRPDAVTFSTPEHDARRRDFTLNGLFQDPFSGKIIDYVGGLDDLEKKTLRAIGNPSERFREDALRLLRAIRFSLRTGFRIGEPTYAALREHASLLTQISAERIREEFSGIITHPSRARGLDLLMDTGLADHFLPELRPLIGCQQPPQYHPEGDVYTHTRIALDLLAENNPTLSASEHLTLCLAVLLHDIAKPPTRAWDPEAGRHRFNGHDTLGAEMARDILRRLRYPNRIIDDVSSIIAFHMRFMHVKSMRTAKLKRFMARPTFPLDLELHRVDCDSSNGLRDNHDFLLAKQEEFSSEPIIPPPLVNGKDLIALGLAPGPAFKEILTEIQTRQLEKNLASREDALELAKELAQKHS